MRRKYETQAIAWIVWQIPTSTLVSFIKMKKTKIDISVHTGSLQSCLVKERAAVWEHRRMIYDGSIQEKEQNT